MTGYWLWQRDLPQKYHDRYIYVYWSMIFRLGLASVPKDRFFFISTEVSGSLSHHYRHALKVFLLSSDESDTQSKRPRLSSLSQSFECQSPATNSCLYISFISIRHWAAQWHVVGHRQLRAEKHVLFPATPSVFVVKKMIFGPVPPWELWRPPVSFILRMTHVIS